MLSILYLRCRVIESLRRRGINGAFNSLFEMPRGEKDGKARAEKDCLSILYLRCRKREDI